MKSWMYVMYLWNRFDWLLVFITNMSQISPVLNLAQKENMDIKHFILLTTWVEEWRCTFTLLVNTIPFGFMWSAYLNHLMALLRINHLLNKAYLNQAVYLIYNSYFLIQFTIKFSYFHSVKENNTVTSLQTCGKESGVLQAEVITLWYLCCVFVEKSKQ